MHFPTWVWPPRFRFHRVTVAKRWSNQKGRDRRVSFFRLASFQGGILYPLHTMIFSIEMSAFGNQCELLSRASRRLRSSTGCIMHTAPIPRGRPSRPGTLCSTGDTTPDSIPVSYIYMITAGSRLLIHSNHTQDERLHSPTLSRLSRPNDPRR